MAILNHCRSIAGIGALAALLLSGNAGATPVSQNITIGGFANGGSLSLVFSGDTGANNLLEHPSEVTSFTASYTDAGTTSISWDLAGLGGLLWDAGTNTLLGLSAFQAPATPGTSPFFLEPYMLLLGADFVANRSNSAEITSLFASNNPLFSAPATGATPAPGTLLLVSLGLILAARRRRA